MMLLIVFVLLVTLWQLDKIDLNMSVVVLIIIRERILFEEINTMIISIIERAELVTIVGYFFLFVRCYCQPSSVDVTLLTGLDHLLDT